MKSMPLSSCISRRKMALVYRPCRVRCAGKDNVGQMGSALSRIRTDRSSFLISCCFFLLWVLSFSSPPFFAVLKELEGLMKRGSKKEIDGLSLEMKFHLKHRTARNRYAAVREG